MPYEFLIALILSTSGIIYVNHMAKLERQGQLLRRGGFARKRIDPLR